MPAMANDFCRKHTIFSNHAGNISLTEKRILDNLKMKRGVVYVEISRSIYKTLKRRNKTGF